MAAFSLVARSANPSHPIQATSAPSASRTAITTARAKQSDTPSADTEAGIGIGIAIAVSMILLALGIFWLFVCRRKRKQKQDNNRDHGQRRVTFDSFGSTLFSARHSIPLQDLHEMEGKGVRRDSEMMTPANSHEASAFPPRGDGVPAEMPTIWNEGYRGRPGSQIRRDSEFTVAVSEEVRPSETPVSEGDRSAVTRGSDKDARYTFLID